jgi:hypothetical protein
MFRSPEPCEAKMPNRVVREGLLSSDAFNALPCEAQMFFVRLMLISDDFGRYDGREMAIKSAAYPMTDIRLSDVSKMLAAVCGAGLVLRYVVDGKPYISIPRFDQRLRQKRERYPAPPEFVSDSDSDSISDSDSDSDSGKHACNCLTVDGQLPDSHAKSKHGSLLEGYSAEFEEFWKIYPRKAGKGAAWKVWSKIKAPVHTLAAISEALEWQKVSRQWVSDGGQYIPHPSTYLNQRRWEDDPKGQPGTVATSSRPPSGWEEDRNIDIPNFLDAFGGEGKV